MQHVNDIEDDECKIIDVIRAPSFKTILISSFLPLIAGAQAPVGAPVAPTGVAPKPTSSALCEKIFREPRYPMTAVTPNGFYRNKQVITCATPILKGEGFVTGCNDGSVKFVGKNGIETGTIALDVDPDDVRPGNVAVVAIPTAVGPQRFLATLTERENAFIFDENLKISKTFSCDSDLSAPLLFSSGTAFFACIGSLYAQFVPKDGILPPKTSLLPPVKVPQIKTDTPGKMEIKSEPADSKPESSVFASVEYSPLLFTAADKKEYAVFVNADGQVILFSEKSEAGTGHLAKVIPVSSVPLSKPVFAADGRLVTVDSSGVVHFVNLEKGEKTSFPLVLTSVLSNNKSLRIDAPALLKDQKIAFLGGERIYFYSLTTLKPYVIFDAALSRRAWYNDGTKDKYVSDPSKGTDILRFDLDPQTELLWVPTRGGVVLLNTIGRAVGVFRFSDSKEESISLPMKMADGSYLFGTHFGMERLNIATKTIPDAIPSGSLVLCN